MNCRHCGANMTHSSCCGRVEVLEAKLAEAQRVRDVMEANWGGTRSEMDEWRETARSEMAGRRAAEAKLAAWEAAESLPDCPACAVLEGECEEGTVLYVGEVEPT